MSTPIPAYYRGLTRQFFTEVASRQERRRIEINTMLNQLAPLLTTVQKFRRPLFDSYCRRLQSYPDVIRFWAKYHERKPKFYIAFLYVSDMGMIKADENGERVELGITQPGLAVNDLEFLTAGGWNTQYRGAFNFHAIARWLERTGRPITELKGDLEPILDHPYTTSVIKTRDGGWVNKKSGDDEKWDKLKLAKGFNARTFLTTEMLERPGVENDD